MNPGLVSALEALGDRLLAASWVAAALALGVALLVRLAPSLPSALRAGLWWLVAARTLVELAGVPAAELAVLPAPSSPAPTVVSTTLPTAGGEGLPVFERFDRATLPRTTPGPLALLALLALPLAAVAGARGVGQLLAARRRVRVAEPILEPGLLDRVETLRTGLGVRRRVVVARSAEVETPQVVGLLRPTILLPDAAALSSEELDWALAHELAHVRRFDALWAFVPFVAERLLVFHPLVRFAAREYALATEAACDAVVLERCAPAADRYGRLLVRLAAGPLTPAPAAVWPLARRPLERRLDMLRRTVLRRRPALLALGASLLLALAIAVPVRLVAQAPTPPEAPSPPAAPALAEAPAPPEAPLPELAPSAESSPQAPSAPRASRPPAAPRPVVVHPTPSVPRIAPVAPVVVAPGVVAPGARWPMAAVPVPDLPAVDVEVSAALETARLALSQSVAAAEQARRVVESSRSEIERAQRVARSTQREAERIAREVEQAHALRQGEIEAEMERLQEQLAELAAELGRAHAEFAEEFGEEMESLREELTRAMGRDAEWRLEAGERLERDEALERLGQQLEQLEERELDVELPADPPR